MSRATAKAFYDQQVGDPPQGYITPADAQAAIDTIYDDVEAADTAEQTARAAAVTAEADARSAADAAEAAARVAADALKADKARTISASGGLTGGGDLSADRTLSIAAGGVTSAMVADGTLVGADMAADTITAREIAANAVGSSELADNAVDTNAIADGSATPAKLATSGRFVFPTGAANGYGFASGAVHLSGTGTPEGVVTAAPGSTWLQTDSTTDVKGWIRWVKATGTGSTDWVAGPEADTGWRTINYTLGLANWIAGNMLLRRVGKTVTLRLATVGMTTLAACYTLPSGFGVGTGRYPLAMCRENASTGNFCAFLSSGTAVPSYGYRLAGTHAGTDRYGGEMIYVTDDAWPASLPGSAA